MAEEKAEKTTELFNPNDRFGKRDGGPYADQVELIVAERQRAAVEKREPDYDNLQPTAGVPALTAAQIAGLNGTAGLGTAEPIASFPTPEPEPVEKVTSKSTDEAKIAAAQAKAIAADEPGTDAQKVSEAVTTA